MVEDKPMTSYERKVKLIMGVSLARYKGEVTVEQLALERVVACNILTSLGVHP
jgi:hypothetical protein